jgi:hypothetical protein
VPSQEGVEIERRLLVGMRLAERGHDLVLAVGGIDGLEPELGDPLLSPPLSDRRRRSGSSQERAGSLGVPRAAFVRADASRPGGEEGLAYAVERFPGNEDDELANVPAQILTAISPRRLA